MNHVPATVFFERQGATEYDAMSLDFRLHRTATGKPELIATGECAWQEFPHRAQAVVDHFGMTVTNKIDGLDERLWIARLGKSQFCVSWDIWFPEVSIMAWKKTPDAAIEQLLEGHSPPMQPPGRGMV